MIHWQVVCCCTSVGKMLSGLSYPSQHEVACVDW